MATRWTEKELESAYAYRAKGLTSAQIAQKLGRTAESVEGRLKPCGARKSEPKARYEKVPFPVDYQSAGEDCNPKTELLPRASGSGNNIEIEARTEGITTLEELIAACNIDLTVWDVERWVANTWPVGTKNETGVGPAIITKNLYQVKAWLKKKPVSIQGVREIFAHCEAKLRETPNYVKKNANKLYEISVPDLHLGKLCWGEETGHANYNSDEATSRFRTAIEDLVGRVSNIDQKVEKVLLPIGNDFFNVDGSDNMTSAGTPQNEDGRWQKSFKRGCDLVSWAIERCSWVAPVDVLIVSGNHDNERSFYLGAFLEAFFRNVKYVNVNNAPNLRKYYSYGNTLLGFTHGDRIKLKDLSRLAQVEQREAWGASKFCEWHLGHLHRESSMEEGGVIARVIPSLTPPDAWHSKAGYVTSVPRAQAFLYDSVAGLEAVNYHTV